MILPYMEYTTDQIGHLFGVSGGSAILSDGTFYWRLDAAEYVEFYGIALPREFLVHGQNRNWKVRDLDPQEYAAVEHELARR